MATHTAVIPDLTPLIPNFLNWKLLGDEKIVEEYTKIVLAASATPNALDRKVKVTVNRLIEDMLRNPGKSPANFELNVVFVHGDGSNTAREIRASVISRVIKGRELGRFETRIREAMRPHLERLFEGLPTKKKKHDINAILNHVGRRCAAILVDENTISADDITVVVVND